MDLILDIKINGAPVKIEKLLRFAVDQKLFEPVKMELEFTYSGDEQATIISDAKNYLGADVEVKIKDNSGFFREKTYKGFTGRVKVNDNSLILFIYSEDFKMTTARKYKSYLDKDVNSMTKEVLGSNGISGTLGTVGSEFLFDFFQQYTETDYDFIKRLAFISGAIFYHDGEKFIYTDKLNGPSVGLDFGNDLIEYELDCTLENTKVTAHSYNHEIHQDGGFSNSAVSQDSGHSFLSESRNKSKSTLHENEDIVLANFLKQQNQVETYTKNLASYTDSKRVRIYGKTLNPFVYVGAKITPKHAINEEEVTVIALKATFDANSYIAEFEAAPNDSKFMPDIKQEEVYKTIVQPALVTDHNDPEILGRVKIKYIWGGSQETFWCRIANPAAGGGRGTHILPQVGDEVLVAFEYGDPSKPIIIGGLYHSEAKPYFNKNSGIKDNSYVEYLLVKTPSGSVIRIYDEEDKEEINITMKESGDTSPCNIKLVTKGKDSKPEITVEASDGTVNLKAKTINFNADENINLSAKGKIVLQAEKDIEATTKQNFKLSATQNMTLEATQNFEAKASTNMKLNSTAGTKVTSSANVEIEASVQAVLKGSLVESSATGMNTIKGATVMIN